MPSIFQGSIVWMNKPDPQGANAKTRPFVVLSDPRTLAPDEPFQAVAISGTFAGMDPDTYVVMPLKKAGRNNTHLTKECVAICTWVITAPREDVIEVKGYVPLPILKEIFEKVQRHTPPV